MNNSILKYISDIPKDRVAFILEHKKYKYKDIFELYEKNKHIVEVLTNKCVVINARKRSEFALLLSILDGNVKRILFMPEDIDKSLLHKYFDESKVNFEVFLENDILKIKEIGSYKYNLTNIENTQWIIPTSGTTNHPKLVAHTFESLTRTSKKDIDIGLKYTWGLTFDIYRFSGIQVFLQGLSGGSSIIIPESYFSMNQILEMFVRYGCNIISATPSFWRKILMSREANNLKLKRITLGGEISDDNVLKALKAKFKNTKLTHIYASTEVGVGFAVTDEKAGFPYSYLTQGIGNIKLKIDENSILWINPNNKIQEYISEKSMYESDGYINTGDMVKISNDRIYFLGRESGAINVGGNKVQPEEVEFKLIDSGYIHSAYVYAKKNSMMGSLVCASVVPKNLDEDRVELKRKILEYCRENLEGFKIPAILKIVNNLEITHSGKIKRE